MGLMALPTVGARPQGWVVLSAALDVFRIRQYFNVVTRGREWVDGLRDDAGLVRDARRALVPLPFDRPRAVRASPFPPFEPFSSVVASGQRLAVVTTGGSGALASLVGVARALEEAAIRPQVFSLCSGSALFGFPIAAGIPAEDVAHFLLALQPDEYIDLDWPMLLRLVPTGGRGFAGMVRGDAIEQIYRRLLGELTLGQMPIPAYAPIWNIEENRLEYLGPRTHPDLPVARAVRMAIALPLFIEPVELDGYSWCDGGLVDIFPVHPVLDIEEPCDVALAINGFYPAGFAGEDATGWEERRGSILFVASQVRTCQQIELARENLSRLRARAEVLMMEPVPYDKVRGVGFYRQFLRTRDWPEFMLAGHAGARRALSAVDPPEVRSQAHRDLRRENEPDQHRRAALSVGTAHDM
jgi:NTE family protein